MTAAATVEWLSKAIGEATRAAKFCVAGSLSGVDPGLEIDGVGAISLPLKRGVGKKIVAACQLAPYGKGTQTLVDKQVRNTYELDPKNFRLGEAWTAAIAEAVGTVARELGLPEQGLEARLYKLLAYERGGFFLPHRDSEKHDRMVASLIVVLPNPFDGGTLIVRHGAEKQTLKFDDAADGKSSCYAAFYADCEHEVQRVTGGLRLCLAYNLVLKAGKGKPAAAAAPAAALALSIGARFAKQPAEPLVFALEHHYTPSGLSLDLLKGADRPIADLVVAAAETADCLVHLAQVSRHLSQFADDGSFEEGYFRSYRQSKRHDLEIGETYEDDLNGTEWTDAEGKKQPWGSIGFKLSSVVSSVPIDDWKPTSEEYEGYTGNAGNTLDRWYHRSAIVLWRRDRHFDVVASSGAASTIPLFASMASKLAKTPKKRLEAARQDGIRLAQAIIDQWPKRQAASWHSRAPSPYDDFPHHLLMLHDRDTVARLLVKLAERDALLPLSSFVVAVCREFGWSAFAPQWKRLISSRPNPHDPKQVSFRDFEWLAAYCCDPTADPDKAALGQELAALATDRFCEKRPPQPKYDSPARTRVPSISETSLRPLLEAILAGGRAEDLLRVLRFVQSSPDAFDVDDCQVPRLKALVPWSKKRFGSVPPPLAEWLNAVRRQLEAATARPPEPTADWARPADVACPCQYCARLKAFLADPASETARIAAPEAMRQHLIDILHRHRLDAKSALVRQGSPYSLTFTKTAASFERAVARFERDRKHLRELPLVE